MYNLVQLRTLHSVLSTGSFAATARELGYTSAAVSQQIASLERSMGVVLFERGAHNVRPTRVAELIADRCRTIVTLLAQLEDEVTDLAAGSSGRLRLGTFPTASPSVIPRSLTRLQVEAPGAQVVLHEGKPDQLLPLLLNHELDVALAYEYTLLPRTWPPELRQVLLFDERLFLLVPAEHAVASAEYAPLSALRDETWIDSREGMPGSQVLARLAADAGFEPKVGFRTMNYEAIHGLVGAGLGLAVVAGLARRQHPNVVALPIRHAGATRRVVALSHRENTNPLLRAMITALKDSTRHLDSSGRPATLSYDLPDGRRNGVADTGPRSHAS